MTDTNKTEELEWIQLRREMDSGSSPVEGLREKMIRKTKANPFVPAGCALTIFALSYGLYSMRSGNAKLSQKMMRLRVVAQGATVCAIVGGLLMGVGR